MAETSIIEFAKSFLKAVVSKRGKQKWLVYALFFGGGDFCYTERERC